MCFTTLQESMNPPQGGRIGLSLVEIRFLNTDGVCWLPRLSGEYLLNPQGVFPLKQGFVAENGRCLLSSILITLPQFLLFCDFWGRSVSWLAKRVLFSRGGKNYVFGFGTPLKPPKRSTLKSKTVLLLFPANPLRKFVFLVVPSVYGFGLVVGFPFNAQLGPPVVPFSPFFGGEGSLTK